MVHKREQLEFLLNDSNIDVFALSETWLTPSSPEAAVIMPGYDAYRKDRSSGHAGGVLLYVKSSIKCRQLLLPNVDVSIEWVGVIITLSSEMSFTVICIYRSPKSKVDFYDHLKVLLKDCNTTNELIVLGDFNANWDEKKARKNLKQITDHHNLTQLIERPTRITSLTQTQIDLIFSNKPERMTKTHNLLTGLSDHNAIFFTLKLSKRRFTNTPSNSPKNSFNIIPKKQEQNLALALNDHDWNHRHLISRQSIYTAAYWH